MEKNDKLLPEETSRLIAHSLALCYIAADFRLVDNSAFRRKMGEYTSKVNTIKPKNKPPVTIEEMEQFMTGMLTNQVGLMLNSHSVSIVSQNNLKFSHAAW